MADPPRPNPQPTESRAESRARSRERFPVTFARAAAGTVAVGATAGAVGWYARRGDGGVDLPATLDAARTAVPGAAGDPAAGSAASVTLPRVPANLAVDHLLSRVTYGATDALRADVARSGPTPWLARQLAPTGLRDPGGDAVLALYPDLALSAADAARAGKHAADVQGQLAQAHLGRAVWSSRQLLELMVDLWSNHFSVPCPSGPAGLTRHRLDADILRKGAFGSYEQLLQAVTVHPATLAHLGSAASAGDDPSEHHARELLETHTVGPGSGITERDVRQAALLLTGFALRDGVARYVPGRHHVGTVTVLQFVHPNGTPEGGRAAVGLLLRYLARHPATATAVARRLAVRFVADEPPPDLVRRLAQVYSRQGTRIAPVLSVLLTSPEFAAAAGTKANRPLERLAATVRTLGTAPPRDRAVLAGLVDALAAAGQRPLAATRPGGYPDVATAWQSPASAIAQFNTAARLVRDAVRTLLPTPPTTRAAAIEAVGRRVLGRPPAAQERAAATALLAAAGLPATVGKGSWQQDETVGLLATLFLDSPAALTR